MTVCVYIHLFAQRYPACVRPTGVARLSIVEVNKNPSLTKREQTAAVCSGFPNKHSTSRATDRDRQTERERERDGQSGLDPLCVSHQREQEVVSLVGLCSGKEFLQL